MHKFIPYTRHLVDREDVDAVVKVLQSEWLTTGPEIEKFEKAFSEYVGVEHAVPEHAIAVSSGTAALHSAMFAIGLKPGDEVIVPVITFIATANVAVLQGARPIFVDVEKSTLLINTELVERKITTKTKAIIAVDYAGQPCDYDKLQAIAKKYNLVLIADACHSLGASYKERKVGTLADISVFSFHPAKHMTTGEGGMMVTDNEEYAERARRFRNHGIDVDREQRVELGTWYYEMSELGHNYRISDFQCALGRSQLKKVDGWVKRRQEIAGRYSKAFVDMPSIQPLLVHKDRTSSYHLYVVCLGVDRKLAFEELRRRNVGVNVHYMPVHLHPFYRRKFKTKPGFCPTAEKKYRQILSLPLYPSMSDEDVEYVIRSMIEVCG